MNAFLHFSAYGISYKFDVAMKQDFKDPQVNDQVRICILNIMMFMCYQQSTSTALMTNFKFSSFAAAEVHILLEHDISIMYIHVCRPQESQLVC